MAQPRIEKQSFNRRPKGGAARRLEGRDTQNNRRARARARHPKPVARLA